MTPMLRWANFGVRVVVIVFVGVFTFVARWPGAADVAVEIAALTVSTVVLAVWVPADRLASAGNYSGLRPFALAVMVALCGAASATPKGGFFILLGVTAAIAAGSDLDFRVGVVVASLGIVATEVTALALGTGGSVPVEYPLVLGLSFVFGRNMRAHWVYADQANQLREEQARVATLDERTRIAREIHDVLAHSLGALGLQIQVARAVLTDQHDEARAVELLEQAQRMATDGLNETRRAIHALRGETLPLPASLAELGAHHQRRYDTRVTFEVSGDVRPLSPDAELAITRTAQEALVNTAKHAPGQPVKIQLEYAEADIKLTIRNHLQGNRGDGRQSLLATVNGGYGLTGVRERLLLLHGALSVGAQDDDWVVVAKVPR